MVDIDDLSEEQLQKIIEDVVDGPKRHSLFEFVDVPCAETDDDRPIGRC